MDFYLKKKENKRRIVYVYAHKIQRTESRPLYLESETVTYIYLNCTMQNKRKMAKKKNPRIKR